MTWIAQAVRGTTEYDTVMRQAVQIGLQGAAGYVAPKIQGVEREFTFLIGSTGLVGFSIRECEVIRLSSEFWIELVFPAEAMKLRYPNVIVFPDFVIFCWSDAMEINYEWCQLEVTRAALIELWESKQP